MDIAVAVALFEKGFTEDRVQETLCRCESVDEAVERLSATRGSSLTSSAVASSASGGGREANAEPVPIEPRDASEFWIKARARWPLLAKEVLQATRLKKEAAASPQAAGQSRPGAEALAAAAEAETAPKRRIEDHGEQVAPDLLGALEAVLPEDAPDGHEAWQKVVSRRAPCQGSGGRYVCFTFLRASGTIQTFSVTLRNCRTEEAMLRVARACYVRCSDGWPKQRVLSFRDQIYAKIRGLEDGRDHGQADEADEAEGPRPRKEARKGADPRGGSLVSGGQQNWRTRKAPKAEPCPGPAADADVRSRRFTPELVLPGVCMARTWAGGRGGQCHSQPKEGGAGLCWAHSAQAVKGGGLPHGRIDGPVPLKKLLEFERFSAGGGAAAPQAAAAPASAGASQEGRPAASQRPAKHQPEPCETVGESREASVVAARAVAQALWELREPFPGGGLATSSSADTRQAASPSSAAEQGDGEEKASGSPRAEVGRVRASPSSSPHSVRLN